MILELESLSDDRLRLLCDSIEAEERRRECLIPNPDLARYLGELSNEEIGTLAESTWAEQLTRYTTSLAVKAAHIEEHGEAAGMAAAERGEHDWPAVFAVRAARLFRYVASCGTSEKQLPVLEQFVDSINRALAKMKDKP